MNQKKAKRIRKYMRAKGWSIEAEPYSKLSNGMIIASQGRQQYQQTKRLLTSGKQ